MTVRFDFLKATATVTIREELATRTATFAFPSPVHALVAYVKGVTFVL